MRYSGEFAAAIFSLILATSAIATGVPALDERAALSASQAVVGSVPADFTLLDRNEKPVRLSAYRGKPLLISFIYTGCFSICPTQTRTLHDAVRGLDRMLGTDQFNVVSVGFNQPFDTPRALRAFAAQNRIDYPNWEFLSPHGKQVEALTRAYGFDFIETPAGFDHLVGVTVVDATGRIHSQVYGDRMSAEMLGTPLRQLILSAPPSGERALTLDQLVDRVRILCTVYDPDTGEYRYDWKLLLEIFGGLAFFLSVAIFFWRERQAYRKPRGATPRAADAAGSQ